MAKLKDPSTPAEVLQRTYGMGGPESEAVAKRIENAERLVAAFKKDGAAVREIVAASDAFPPPKVNSPPQPAPQPANPLQE